MNLLDFRFHLFFLLIFFFLIFWLLLKAGPKTFLSWLTMISIPLWFELYPIWLLGIFYNFMNFTHNNIKIAFHKEFLLDFLFLSSSYIVHWILHGSLLLIAIQFTNNRIHFWFEMGLMCVEHFGYHFAVLFSGRHQFNTLENVHPAI